MKGSILFSVAILASAYGGNASAAGTARAAVKADAGLDRIQNIVVIYAENRSFDNLYGFLPGANGLQHVSRAKSLRLDRDGSVLKQLPPCGAD